MANSSVIKRPISGILLFVILWHVTDALYCLSCSRDDCLTPLMENEQKNCIDESNECVSLFENYKVTKRDCLAELSEDEKVICNGNDKNCDKCSEDNCNFLSHVDHQCVTCTSLNDRDCIDPPAQPPTERCNASMVTEGFFCYTRLIGNEIYRGCITKNEELTDCDDDEFCAKCNIFSDASNCNKFIYPENRTTCFKCDNNCDNKEEFTSGYVCDFSHDSCYTKYDTAGNMVQLGCLSSLADDGCNDTEFCEICNGSNCNEPIEVVESSNCVQCDQNDDKNCAINPEQIQATECNGNSTCYTRLTNGSISRGCFNDLNEIEQNNCFENAAECDQCSVNGCNKYIFPAARLKCHQCDSKVDRSCLNVLQNNKPEYCLNFYIYNTMCVQILRDDGSVLRECSTAELTEDECKNSTLCEYCPTDGCNGDVLNIQQITTPIDCSDDNGGVTQPPVTQPPVTTVKPTNGLNSGNMLTRNFAILVISVVTLFVIQLL